MTARHDLPEEIWKPLIGFENPYEISNLGRIWSVKRPHPAVKTGCLVAGRRDKHGYVKITIDRKTYAVHRLVLMTFCGAQPPGAQAAHNNGCPSDNRLTNLRWATVKENMADKKLHGTYRLGVTHKAAKLSAAQVGEIRRLRRARWPWRDLAARYHVSEMTACSAGIGRTYADLNSTYPPASRGRRYDESASK